MLIHTAVASLAPLQVHQRRRKKPVTPAPPPDMLSGGGRQVLASYTAFSYQGNFSDVSCRLMDILPHQSPAVGVSSNHLRDACPPSSKKFLSSSRMGLNYPSWTHIPTVSGCCCIVVPGSGIAKQEAAAMVCLFQGKGCIRTGKFENWPSGTYMCVKNAVQIASLHSLRAARREVSSSAGY